MRDNRWFRWVVILLCSLIVLSGVMALNSTAEKTKYVLHVVVSDSENERWDACFSGMKQAARDFSADLEIADTPFFDSQEDENAFLEEDMRRYDGFIVQWQDSNVDRQTVDSLIHYGPIVSLETGLTTSMTKSWANIMTQDEQLGKSLASEVVLKNGEDLSHMHIEIVTGSLLKQSNRLRYDALYTALEMTGAPIDYAVEKAEDVHTEGIDVIVVCDALLMEQVYEKTEGTSIQVYGTGADSNLIHGVDTGEVQSLLVVNEYYAGYESVSELIKRLKRPFVAMQDVEVPYAVVNKSNLYSKENQKLLFQDRS